MNKQLFDSIFSRLISFSSFSGKNNIEIINYIQNFFQEYNIPCFFSGKDLNHQKNLYAILGPLQEGGLVLSGHTDVVNVTESQWNSPPFELSERNNHYFGRGTCDMKGFLALIMSMVPDIMDSNFKKPVCMAFSYDEETDCDGAKHLTESFGKSLPIPEIAIIGEPSMNEIIVAHKGDSHHICEFFGSPGHSSIPDKGVNAIYYAAKAISELQKIYEDTGEKLEKNDRYEPPHSSLSVGLIEGGTSVNTIPGYCKFEWETRCLNNRDSDYISNRFEEFVSQQLLLKMRAKSPKTDIRIKKLYSSPALEYKPESLAIQCIEKYLDSTSEQKFVSFGTEAGYFQNKGISSIVWGPGSIEQAHKDNEFIALDSLKDYYQKLKKVIFDFCK